MRRLIRALLAATIAFATPATGAWAATGSQTAATSGPSESQTTPLFARVARPFGTAVRVGPSPYHEQLASLACGEVGYVVARRDGWVEVQYGDVTGWVSEAHVKLGGSAPPADCTGARVLPVGSQATASAPAGCASLRARPASYTVERACVEDGQEVEIVSGPSDPDGRDAWFEVWSPSKGPGWMLGDYLFAV